MIAAMLAVLALSSAAPALANPQDRPAMPLIEAPVMADAGDTLAIFYSGDSGWNGLSREVSADLVQAGIPVVGVDSLKYYWRRRTPDGAAADLAAVIEDHAVAWDRARVVLIGYSFGADALPLLLEHLPPQTRARVRAMVLISPAAQAHLAFRFASWFDIPLPGGYPVARALADDEPTPVTCVQGAEDPRAACLRFPADAVHAVVLPGGHRYYGERDHLARLILDATAPPPPADPRPQGLP